MFAFPSFFHQSVTPPDQEQEDNILRNQHRCELPPELPKKWPLVIDRIKELWTSNTEGRLLAFLCSVAIDYEPGNSLYQYFLFGPPAFHVLRPENVEAILSTNFKGAPRQYNFLNIYWIPFMLCRLWFWREAGYFCPSIGHCLHNPPEFQRACTNVHRFVEQYIDSLNLSNENDSLDDR